MSTQSQKQLKTARVLHDQAKRKSRSDRPTNVYKELITDDETGITQWWIWYATELGKEVGRKSLDKVDELTQIRTEEGYEYTIPYNDANKKKVLEKRFGGSKFYHKDGEQTTGPLKEPQVEF